MVVAEGANEVGSDDGIDAALFRRLLEAQGSEVGGGRLQNAAADGYVNLLAVRQSGEQKSKSDERELSHELSQ
jgi:hypothetical protein